MGTLAAVILTNIMSFLRLTKLFGPHVNPIRERILLYVTKHMHVVEVQERSEAVCAESRAESHGGPRLNWPCWSLSREGSGIAVQSAL